MIIPIAISLGFLGSFHCVGMCGPIALALPLDRSSKLKTLIGSLLYNFGRMLTYSLLGLLFGLIGQGFFIAGYQNILSISLGILILVLLLFNTKQFKFISQLQTKFSFLGKIKSGIINLFGRKSNSALFLIGLLNGLLPCGLVYIGIAGAIATGDALYGSLFMFFFGFGTLPAMLFINMISGSLSLAGRNKIKRFVPFAVGIMAVLLIVRGLNLGIPMISPEMTKKEIIVKEKNGTSVKKTVCVQDCCKEE